MNCEELIAKTKKSDLYTLHTHTQFCDGRASIRDFVEAAVERNFSLLGFTPHSPIPLESPCNMTETDVKAYLNEISNIKENTQHTPLEILTGMEVDFLSPSWGAHIDYFQNLHLDYIISSIHFVPTKKHEMIDIDGKYESFQSKLNKYFNNDIDYVAKIYIENTHKMLDLGGFQIVGHFDKISMNGSYFYPELENQNWYQDSIHEIIQHIAEKNYIVEINTKAYELHNRFFPNVQWWPYLLEKKIPVIFNSDAHYPEKINLSREIAMKEWKKMKKK